jgi:glycosyltransferase involved in cell wall biosynthesis
VTPSYNQAQYIEATIKSVLDQDYPNLEYIVIDGGSDDGSVEVIQNHADQLAYWVSEPDSGQTEALIKGFKRSSGEIMCWLNSDDLLMPGTLHEVAAVFARKPNWQVVYGDDLLIDPEGRVILVEKEIGFNRFIWMYHFNYIPQPSTFWRRSIYERVGGLDARWDLAMDADLWIRFAEHTDLHHVPRVWSQFRVYPDQKNQRLRTKSDAEDALIRSRYLGREPLWSRRLKRVAAKGLRAVLLTARGRYWYKLTG